MYARYHGRSPKTRFWILRSDIEEIGGNTEKICPRESLVLVETILILILSFKIH